MGLIEDVEWNIAKADVSEAIRMLVPSDVNLRMMLAISVMSLFKQGRKRDEIVRLVNDVISGTIT